MVMTLWIYVNINTPSAVDLRHQSEEKVQPPRMLQYWIIPKPGYYFELYAKRSLSTKFADCVLALWHLLARLLLLDLARPCSFLLLHQKVVL